MNYFTIKKSFFLVPSKECCEEIEKIDKFLYILEKSGIGTIIEKAYKKDKIVDCGRKSYNPFNMFAMVVFCSAMFDNSLRNLEELCKFDLRVMYIMEQETPDHSVIGDFINKYIVPYQYEIFTMINIAIINEFNIDIRDCYLDGTKLEANANKYKFVWKPTTYHKKLDIKIKELLNEMNFDFPDKTLIKPYQLKTFIDNYIEKENIDINSIPTGKGKRLTKEQKNYKLAYQYLIKLLEYEEKEEICGENRNSYYKTDQDATAMVLKEDYYSKASHDFHAGYNIQIIVSNLLILMYGIFQQRDDHYTFIPMNDLYYKYYKAYPNNMCADSGYGIYENYKYIKKHNIGNYVKFQQWEGESSGKKPQLFYTFDDGVICLNGCIGEIISFNVAYHQRYKGGRLFKFIGCNNCNYDYICKKNLKNKNLDYRLFELSPEYELLKEEARQKLLSPKGIEIRINRSIQVEGAFGQIKQNMKYTRIRRRGLNNVSCEIMLMCLGKNIRRFFNLLDNHKSKKSYWNKPYNLKAETFPFPKQKKKKSCRN